MDKWIDNHVVLLLLIIDIGVTILWRWWRNRNHIKMSIYQKRIIYCALKVFERKILETCQDNNELAYIMSATGYEMEDISTLLREIDRLKEKTNV